MQQYLKRYYGTVDESSTIYCVALLSSNLTYTPSAMAGRHVGRQMKYK